MKNANRVGEVRLIKKLDKEGYYWRIDVDLYINGKRQPNPNETIYDQNGGLIRVESWKKYGNPNSKSIEERNAINKSEEYKNEELKEKARLKKKYQRKLEEFRNKVIENNLRTCNTSIITYGQEWLEEIKLFRSAQTYKSYKNSFNNFINFLESKQINLAIGKITTKEIEAFYRYSFQNNKRINTVRIYKKVVNLIFRKAYEQKIIKTNPASKAKLEIPYNIKLLEATRENELDFIPSKRVNEVLNKFKNDELYPLVFIAINTGFRKGELLGLTWECVDFENKRIKVALNAQDNGGYSTKLKTPGSARTNLVSNSVLECLKKIKKEQDNNKAILGKSYKDCGYNLVFRHKDGTPYNPHNILTPIQKVLKDTDFCNITFHHFRHTFCSAMINAKNENGGNIYNVLEVSHLMGHDNTNTTLKYYARFEEEDRNDKANAAQEYIERANNVRQLLDDEEKIA